MKLLSCAFNFDTGRVELLFDDESALLIDCTAIENQYYDPAQTERAGLVDLQRTAVLCANAAGRVDGAISQQRNKVNISTNGHWHTPVPFQLRSIQEEQPMSRKKNKTVAELRAAEAKAVQERDAKNAYIKDLHKQISEATRQERNKHLYARGGELTHHLQDNTELLTDDGGVYGAAAVIFSVGKFYFPGGRIISLQFLVVPEGRDLKLRGVVVAGERFPRPPDCQQPF